MWFCGDSMRRSKRASDFQSTVQEFYDHPKKWSKTMSIEKFNILLFAAKRAAKKCGLAFRSTGLQYKNGKRKCGILFFPGDDASFYRTGTSIPYVQILNPLFLALPHDAQYYPVKKTKKLLLEQLPYSIYKNDVYSVDDCAEICHNLAIQIAPRDNMDGIPNTEFTRETVLDEAEIRMFFHEYIAELCNLEVICESKDSFFCDWNNSDDALLYGKNPHIYVSNKPVSSFGKKTVFNSGDSIFFASTLFSLLKPVYKICKFTDYLDFIVQLTPNVNPKDAAHYKTGLFYLEMQSRIWCNYRKWGAITKKSKDPYKNRFRKRISEQISSAPLYHKGFPISIFNYKKQDNAEDEIKLIFDAANNPIVNLSSTQVKQFAAYPCLVLMFPIYTPSKAYPKRFCLTLEITSPQKVPDRLHNFDYLSEIHHIANARYMYYIDAAAKISYKKTRKALKKYYRIALSRLCPNLEKCESKDYQLAFLLGSLYYINSILEGRGDDEVIYLKSKICEFEREIGIVTIDDFRNYISNLLHERKNTAKIRFAENNEFVYLEFGEKYWEDFLRFCNNNGIRLGISRTQFQKDYLIANGILIPQYQPKNGGYARYDCKKKFGSETVRVMKISKKALGIKD